MTIKRITRFSCSIGTFLSVVTLAVAATACHRLTPMEKKLVGAWKFTGLDATGLVVFRSDHTVVDLMREKDPFGWDPRGRWVPVSWGTWRLEGNDVITEEKVLPLPNYSFANRSYRMPVKELRDDTLVRGDGRSDFTRVSVMVLRRPQFLAIGYMLASLIAMLASIFAIRR